MGAAVRGGGGGGSRRGDGGLHRDAAAVVEQPQWRRQLLPPGGPGPQRWRQRRTLAACRGERVPTGAEGARRTPQTAWGWHVDFVAFFSTRDENDL